MSSWVDPRLRNRAREEFVSKFERNNNPYAMDKTRYREQMQQFYHGVRALQSFHIDNRQMGGVMQPRLIDDTGRVLLTIDEVFDKIDRAHLQCDHKGANTTWNSVKDQFPSKNISLAMVKQFVAICPVCQTKNRQVEVRERIPPEPTPPEHHQQSQPVVSNSNASNFGQFANYQQQRMAHQQPLPPATTHKANNAAIQAIHGLANTTGISSTFVPSTTVPHTPSAFKPTTFQHYSSSPNIPFFSSTTCSSSTASVAPSSGPTKSNWMPIFTSTPVVPKIAQQTRMPQIHLTPADLERPIVSDPTQQHPTTSKPSMKQLIKDFVHSNDADPHDSHLTAGLVLENSFLDYMNDSNLEVSHQNNTKYVGIINPTIASQQQQKQQNSRLMMPRPQAMRVVELKQRHLGIQTGPIVPKPTETENRQQIQENLSLVKVKSEPAEYTLEQKLRRTLIFEESLLLTDKECLTILLQLANETFGGWHLSESTNSPGQFFFAHKRPGVRGFQQTQWEEPKEWREEVKKRLPDKSAALDKEYNEDSDDEEEEQSDEEEKENEPAADEGVPANPHEQSSSFIMRPFNDTNDALGWINMPNENGQPEQMGSQENGQAPVNDVHGDQSTIDIADFIEHFDAQLAPTNGNEGKSSQDPLSISIIYRDLLQNPHEEELDVVNVDDGQAGQVSTTMVAVANPSIKSTTTKGIKAGTSASVGQISFSTFANANLATDVHKSPIIVQTEEPPPANEFEEDKANDDDQMDESREVGFVDDERANNAKNNRQLAKKTIPNEGNGGPSIKKNVVRRSIVEQSSDDEDEEVRKRPFLGSFRRFQLCVPDVEPLIRKMKLENLNPEVIMKLEKKKLQRIRPPSPAYLRPQRNTRRSSIRSGRFSHVDANDIPPEERFICHTCPFPFVVFDNQKDYREHMAQRHHTIVAECDELREFVKGRYVMLNRLEFSCDSCGKIFDDMTTSANERAGDWQQHRLAIHDEEDPANENIADILTQIENSGKMGKPHPFLRVKKEEPPSDTDEVVVVHAANDSDSEDEVKELDPEWKTHKKDEKNPWWPKKYKKEGKEKKRGGSKGVHRMVKREIKEELMSGSFGSTLGKKAKMKDTFDEQIGKDCHGDGGQEEMPFPHIGRQSMQSQNRHPFPMQPKIVVVTEEHQQEEEEPKNRGKKRPAGSGKEATADLRRKVIKSEPTQARYGLPTSSSYQYQMPSTSNSNGHLPSTSAASSSLRCQYCGTTFSREYALNLHISSAHPSQTLRNSKTGY